MLEQKKHTSGQFDLDMQHLFSLLLTMGKLVEQQLTNAMRVIRGDEGVDAQAVIKGDKQVNAMEVAIDEACVTLIARRQPVAQDLRFIITVLKTASELERIGDTVDKLCRTLLHNDIAKEHVVLEKMQLMAQQAIAMLHNSLNALNEMDLNYAIEVYAQDQQIDQQYRALKSEITDLMRANPDELERFITVLMCTRALERIGDRSQNICEFIYYYLKGHFPRHNDIQA
ncbi:phosphate signaling complex protein PhoU [Pasteurellaceae bacterium 20609_3]|uniref:phosphate signaling complex protein PhoU n=1 Tax=Spirabiliibacterium mucosae TaxID=28156 RepID=UPI001AACBE18|nr:phosphate signaling complex protein PhoU [Spirabiliibacterium mucosae]MBE2898759.1 phosphate signaling complex protein PhoU [Spirabiliibacterium mucosae]